MSFFDQPAKVTRFKLVHAVWRPQRMEVLTGVAPVALLLARTDDTVVGLTDVRGIQADSCSCCACAGARSSTPTRS